MENCLFCKIAEGQIPSNIVYQDDTVVAFADINPQAPHHILLIPRRHIASMADLTDNDGDMLAHLFTTAAKIAREQGFRRRVSFPYQRRTGCRSKRLSPAFSPVRRAQARLASRLKQFSCVSP